MDILLLGGRNFLGRHIVESIKSTSHNLTLFNRGRTNPALYLDLEFIQGDRQKDFHLFDGRRWDVVIDTSGYFPDDVSQLANTLKDKVNHYIFISSCSVYDHNVVNTRFDEAGPIVSLDINLNDSSWDTYGARKYLCEREIDKHFADRVTHIRPGLIVGPYDSTYRFPYWIERIQEGGKILTPGYKMAPLQFLDARDLSDWIVQIIKDKTMGTYNAMGPEDTLLTFGSFLEVALSTLNPHAQLEWVSEEFLRERSVTCWSMLPLWVYKEIEAFLTRDATKARSCGLKFRPIENTIKDTFKWLSSSHPNDEFKSSTLTKVREEELLLEWSALNH